MSLPSWLAPLRDAAEMREADRTTIEERGVPGLELMERAGAHVARAAEERAPAGRIVVVAGGGNNGGDGLVAARLLRENGREVDVLALGDVDRLRGDARTNLERLPGARPAPWAPERLAGAALAIDAILGTGFTGAPREPARGAIAALSAADAPPVLAVDVPSGVDASTGRVDDVAVCADLTVTFHAPKPGLWIAPGKQHAGRVVVVDIGIEPDAGPEPQAGLIEDAVLAGLPPRGAGSTKFDSGVVVVVGGSRGLTGAPCLASEAAQRGGAGYVTACIPASLNVIFELRLLEAMTVPLPDADGALAPEAAEPALARAARAGVLVLGPGFGRAEGSLALARELAQRAELPVVIDADGLNAHAERLGELAGRAQPTVLTPHAGELGRLLGEGSDAVEAARLESARRAAAEARAIVVLKGDDSIVAEPDGRAAVARGDSPGLATAGTGDVLSGLLAALIGRGLAPFHAACAAVHAHQVAGRLAADAHHGPEGVIARDVIEALPAALAS